MRASRGFTLIETVFAAAILTGAALIALHMAASIRAAVEEAETLHNAARALEELDGWLNARGFEAVSSWTSSGPARALAFESEADGFLHGPDSAGSTAAALAKSLSPPVLIELRRTSVGNAPRSPAACLPLEARVYALPWPSEKRLASPFAPPPAGADFIAVSLTVVSRKK